MELTPKQIVRELDRYIIGQDDAKRAPCATVIAAHSFPRRFARRLCPRTS